MGDRLPCYRCSHDDMNYKMLCAKVSSEAVMVCHRVQAYLRELRMVRNRRVLENLMVAWNEFVVTRGKGKRAS